MVTGRLLCLREALLIRWLELGSESWEGENHSNALGRIFVSRRNIKCKDPERGVSTSWSRNREKHYIWGSVRRGSEQGNESRDIEGPKSLWPCGSWVRRWDFILVAMTPLENFPARGWHDVIIKTSLWQLRRRWCMVYRSTGSRALLTGSHSHPDKRQRSSAQDVVSS